MAHKVIVADNGQEVIDRLEVLKPDILILDIRMPSLLLSMMLLIM